MTCMFFSLVSCRYGLYKNLQKDDHLRESQKEDFLTINFQSLINKLPNGIPFFYIGTKDSYHFFIYFYDGWTKMIVKYKTRKEEFTPESIIEYSNENLFLKKYPIYPKEFKNKKVE